MEEMKKFNPREYPQFDRAHTDDGDYRMIPASDWLPPDFQDVPALEIDTGELLSVYYAPIYHCFFSSNGGRKIEVEGLDFWLKRVN